MSVMMASASSLSTSLSSTLASHPAFVGSGWIFSSIAFSTYYTTVFLKHGIPTQTKVDDFHQRQMEIMSGNQEDPQQKLRSSKSKLISTLEIISRPKLLTLYRFAGSLFLGIFAHPDVFDCAKRLMDTMTYMGVFALPAAFLFTANYCNSIALDRIGISLTYTSKCLIPLITVLLTLCVDGTNALPSTLSLMMLLPIASGVALASWNSPTFEKKGFIAAITSSTAQAALNVSVKRALSKTGISGLQAQRSMASVALIISICLTAQTFLGQQDRMDAGKRAAQPLPPFGLSFAAVAAYHYEYVLSFLFLKMVNPIGYGTCDAVRRLGIIVAGRKFFGGEPFSLINYGGISLALLGAMGYSIASAKK
jgi:hypothetical protein